MANQVQEKSPTRILRIRYIVAISTIALVSIAAHQGIRLTIQRNSSDAAEINVAGRQRMLSQRLTKATLAIQGSTKTEITDRYIQELEDVVNLWETSHKGLQLGDESLQLPGKNSATVKQLFANIQDAHDTMVAGAKGILTLAKTQPNSLNQSPKFSVFIAQILEQEGRFLPGMDAIVGQYQREAEARVRRMSQIQTLSLAMTLLLLLLEAMLIFHPALRQIERFIEAIQVAKTKAAALSAQLEMQNTELETSLEDAYSATRLKSEFLANLNHELLTPMNATIGMTSLLQKTQLTSQQEDYVTTIHQNGNILLEMIHDILDFTKIEAGQLELENNPLNLRELIEQSLDLVAPKAAEKGLDLLYQIDSGTSIQVIGDFSRLQQILLNLLTNAVKFTNSGNVVVSVTAENLGHWSMDRRDPENEPPRQQYQEIQFSVRDTGIGIPKEKFDLLFRSFCQVDGSNIREYGGLGLGLAICKRLTELMGGRLWVESQAGVGSTFCFAIAAAVDPNIVDPLSQVQPELEGKRLLIVDDRPVSRQILREQTEKWGMICQEASSGTEALNLIRQGHQFDVAFLEEQMPQMDGLSLARLIHQENRLPNLKLALVSAIACPVQLTDRHFIACLNKPIKVSQLYQMTLGLLAPSSIKPPIEKSETQNAEDFADRLPLRILLAEDNVVNQKVALRILKLLGYNADVANNGLEAIAALQENPYDLVLMDLQMPKMDGLEATRHICQQWGENLSADYGTQTKPWIIAVTAGGTNGDRAQCLEAGMDDYLNKPIKIELLQKALERLVERSPSGTFASETSFLKEDPVDMQNLLQKPAVSNGEKATIAGDDLVTVDFTVLEKLRQSFMAEENPENYDVVQEIVDLFLQDTSLLLTAISNAVQEQDPEGLRYAVHTLKGSTLNLGLRKMYHLCVQLQKLGDRGSFQKAATAFSELQAEFIQVQAALE